MGSPAKAPQFLASALFGLIRFVLWTMMIIAIFALALLGLTGVISAVSHWDWSNWVNSLLLLVVGAITLSAVPLLAFRALDAQPWAKRAHEWYLQKLSVFWAVVLAPLLVYGVLAFFIVVIGLAWAILLVVQGQTSLPNTASWYLMGTLVILAFTLWGQRAVKRVLHWMAGARLELPWLMYLLRPSLMRVYVYAVLAVAYFLSTFENCAGAALIPWVWWETFRQIIVEMLLTYVAIDGAFVALRDHREAIVGKVG